MKKDAVICTLDQMEKVLLANGSVFETVFEIGCTDSVRIRHISGQPFPPSGKVRKMIEEDA